MATIDPSKKNKTSTSEGVDLTKLSLPEGRDQMCLLPTYLVRRHLATVVEWVQKGNFVIVLRNSRRVAMMAPMNDKARDEFKRMCQLDALRRQTPPTIKLTKAQIQKFQ